jgi:maltose alpha-D-glucosyltransferase/alpha-amylase
MKRSGRDVVSLDGDPLWYRDAVIYETHVRAFCDSDGDGHGDFPGLTSKLDYLQDLGVTAIWLLPFYPSPLKDDGYDIADYMDVNPSYGTLSDFRTFLREAHRRSLRVVTELVLNHTSDQHPWFQRARRSPPGSAARNFYVWSDTSDRYRDARIIFKDFESSNWSWDPVARAYYWHRFYSHQPDLNFESAVVRRHLFQVLDFWLKMGVDGLRLDAIPYLYEREGTNCENLAETHALLKKLRRHVDQAFRARMLLAEANQWPEDAAAYFGDGDECHMAFHFPLMPRMFMAVRMEDRFPIVDILGQTPAIPPTAQWALFLRNHDELTLEMVTDEERDYMYRVYARDRQMRINLGIRRRLAPLLGNDRRKIELMKGLLFSLPGTPIIYYGDEIGMGDNFYLGDRDGVRTPMQWSGDRNAGFSRAAPQRLYLPIITDPEYNFEAVNVEVQQNNPSSPLWWTKRVIALRKRFLAFGRGTLEFLYPDNRRVLVFLRRYEDETILVVANLSRFSQHVELDLSAHAGVVPVELFGQTRFPVVGSSPYVLTLGPHDYFWFELQAPRRPEPARGAALLAATLIVPGGWEGLWKGRGKALLEASLPGYLAGRRWFVGKGRSIKSAEISDAIPMGEDGSARLTICHLEYVEGDPENYVLPMAFASGEKALQLKHDHPQAIVAELRPRPDAESEAGLVFDAVYDERFAASLLGAIARRRRWKAARGEVVASRTRAFPALAGATISLPANVLRGEQTNTSIVYGEQLILKLFRRPEEGINPDLEVGTFLTEKTTLTHIPRVAGSIELRPPRGEPTALAILQGFVPNHGVAWDYTLDALARYLERMLGRLAETPQPPLPAEPPLALARSEWPDQVHEFIGTYAESAALLGERTAELHLALASRPDDPEFAPEPFSTLYQRSVYQSIRSQAIQTLQMLRKRQRDLQPEAREDAQAVLDREAELSRRFHQILNVKISAMRMRIHGDYHLGQLLFTGKDFVIIDFEGEPARPLSARRLKRSALVDVAGMLRSFDYAARTALAGARGALRLEDASPLEPWAAFWTRWISAAFLKAYLRRSAAGAFLPASDTQLAVLLDLYTLEKALYELGYELQARPDWVRVPLAGILQILGPVPEGPEKAGS